MVIYLFLSLSTSITLRKAPGIYIHCEKRLLTSSCLSVHLSAWSNSAPIGEIFMKFDYERFSKICR